MDKIQEELNKFLSLFQSLGLATINKEGIPLSSYAPMIYLDGAFYIIISAAAPHYHNIMGNPTIGAILLEDEGSAGSIFFRKRLSFSAEATFVKPDQVIKEALIDAHGEMVNMLLDKMDFSIVKIDPLEGVFVIGPGQAYKVNDKLQVQEQSKGAKNKGHL